MHHPSIFLAVLSLTWQDAGPPEYFPPNLYLVRAKAEKIAKGRDAIQVSTWVVTHVYAGPASMKDNRFDYMLYPLGPTGLYPADHIIRVGSVKEGVEGLWWIAWSPKEGRLQAVILTSALAQYQLQAFPYLIQPGKRLKADDIKYQEGLQWAEAIESVYKLKSSKEREDRLKHLASSADRSIGGWAINLLSNAPHQRSTKILRSLLADENLPGFSRASLDRALCSVDLASWRSDAARRKLLRHCFDPEKADLVSFQFGSERLLEASQDDQIDFPLYADIVEAALMQADRLDKGKVYWLGRAIRSPWYSALDRPKAFEWLTGLIQQSKSLAIRTDAASGLATLRPLSKMQVETIRKIRKETAEAEIRRELDIILKSPSAHAPLRARTKSGVARPLADSNHKLVRSW